jgi:hypothetical protein
MRANPSAARPASARRSLMAALSLCLLLVGGSVAVADAYGPGRPVNNQEGTAPGSGGDGGGGGSTNKVALGMAIPDGRSLAEVDAFTASVGGRKPAIWAIWSAWGHAGSRDFPMSMANGLKERGITPFIWWEPVTPSDLSDPTYARHANVNAGTHDAYIRQYARDARDFGTTVLLRFAHEVNNNYFPWSVNSFDNSPESFFAMWRRVHGIFQQEGATNVRFVWSVAKKSCPGGCNPYVEVYPGDAWVDVMAFSGYNWGAFKDNWMSMYDSYRRVTEHLAAISNKPIMVAETASNSEGGDKPTWIRDGYREVHEKLPQIKAIVYLSADLRDVGHPDWRITTPAEALTAYAEIAALPQFQVANPFRARSEARTRKLAPQKDASSTKQGKARATKQAATTNEPKRAPRVRKGSEAEAQPGAGSKVDKATNRTTKRKKRPKGQPDEPPATLDTFNR